MIDIIEMTKEYICPELLVLIPALYFIGWCFCQSEKISNKLIPALLGVCGVVLALLYMVSTAEVLTLQTVFATIFASIVQGLLCAAAAVFVDQLKKQAERDE